MWRKPKKKWNRIEIGNSQLEIEIILSKSETLRPIVDKAEDQNILWAFLYRGK